MELAEKLGVSFQQIQKYEKGITRISVSRLKDISDALGVDISEFFIGYNLSIKGVEEPSAPYGLEPKYPLNKEEMRLLKVFRKIRTPSLRNGALSLVKGILELERAQVKNIPE